MQTWIEACVLLKITSFFLRSACCNNVFSLGQTDGRRYHDSPLPKTSSWMEDCTKFGQLILSKIIKIVATSCQILRLKCTKFDFGWGSAPDPAGSAHSAPQTPWLDLRGLLLWQMTWTLQIGAGRRESISLFQSWRRRTLLLTNFSTLFIVTVQQDANYPDAAVDVMDFLYCNMWSMPNCKPQQHPRDWYWGEGGRRRRRHWQFNSLELIRWTNELFW